MLDVPFQLSSIAHVIDGDRRHYSAGHRLHRHEVRLAAAATQSVGLDLVHGR